MSLSATLANAALRAQRRPAGAQRHRQQRRQRQYPGLQPQGPEPGGGGRRRPRRRRRGRPRSRASPTQFLTEEIRRQSSVAGRSEALAALPGPAPDRVRRARRQPRPRAPDRRAAGRARCARHQPRDLGAGAPGAERGRRARPGDRRPRRPGAGAARRCRSGDRPTVAAINAELQAVHELNVEIERLAHLGQVNPELLDRRDVLIKSLAEKIDVRTFVQDNGALAIYTAGGETLLDATPRVLIYDPANLVAQTPRSARSRSSARTRSIRRPASRSTRAPASSWCAAACARR